MLIKFLNIDEHEAILLGYELKLTPNEHKILLAIAKRSQISADEIIYLYNISRGSVSVYISGINKKAYALSGRKLVLFEKAHYKINPYM